MHAYINSRYFSSTYLYHKLKTINETGQAVRRKLFWNTSIFEQVLVSYNMFFNTTYLNKLFRNDCNGFFLRPNLLPLIDAHGGIIKKII